MIDLLNYIQEKTDELLMAHNNKELFDDPNLIYDYNEVLELFYGSKLPVFINGSSKLNKTELLNQVVTELGEQGYNNKEVIYIDCRVPFLRQLDVINFASKENVKFIAINEIQELSNFEEVIDHFYNELSNIKLIATCSVPEILYELQYDKYSCLKIVVLSEKNDSNIKIDQISFGIDGDLKYNIKNGVCEIKGMTKEGKLKKRHMIPEFIKGYPVKIIASGAFHHRTEIEEVIIPDTVEYIGDYAFTYCDNLSKIKLPNALKHIGDCSFLGAKKLNVISGGNNIIHIGHSAFYGTKWLSQQKGDFAVLGKTIYKYLSLKQEVVIPKNITTLGNYAFSNSKIKTIKLLNQKLGEGVFYNCKDLEEVIGFHETIIPSYSFYNCQSLVTNIDNISEAGSFSFYNCKSIEKVTFSNSIIKNNGFENCKNLKFPLGLIYHAGLASFYASNVMNADLRETIFIDEFAFAYTKIRRQSIDRVSQVNAYAFMNIDTLEEINFSKTATLGKGALYGSIHIKKASIGGLYPLRYYFLVEPHIEELTVLSSTCDNFARDNKTLKKIVLFGDKIGDWAFYNNLNLEKVQISTHKLGNWSFSRCNKLSEVVIPKQISYIDMNCFRYCEHLNKIVIENPNLVSFGPNAFYSTGLNKEIFVCNKQQYLVDELWSEYANHLVEIKKHKKIVNLMENKFVELDESIHEIVLQNATIVNKDMFKGINNVRTLSIHGDEIVIDMFTFRDWTLLEHVIVKANSLKIDDSAFEGCINVLDYDLPDNTVICGCRVFKNNKSLQKIKLPLMTKRIENGLFAYCENLKRIELHEEIHLISDKAFQFNTNLKYLILLKSIKEIGEKCFKGCKNLELLYIPSEIKNIPENAFIGCENLSICSEKELTLIHDKINLFHHENIYDRFSYCLEQYFTILNKQIIVEIDRPLGSAHPKRENLYYPINYGFVPGKMGKDGEEQDVYVIDSKIKKHKTEVKIIGILMRLDDVETKWIGIESDNRTYSKTDIQSIVNFQEKYYKTVILK